MKKIENMSYAELVELEKKDSKTERSHGFAAYRT